jgi:hypothetical protein
MKPDRIVVRLSEWHLLSISNIKYYQFVSIDYECETCIFGKKILETGNT